MPNIKNNNQLIEFLSLAATDAIEKSSQDIDDVVKKNIIKYTYQHDYYPNVSYLAGNGYPSMQFLEAFKWNKTKKQADEVEKTLAYDSSDMDFEPDIYWHGSNVGGDARENLADILNVTGYTSSWGWKKRKPYWNITIFELIGQKLIGRFIGRYLRPYGFVKKRG